MATILDDEDENFICNPTSISLCRKLQIIFLRRSYMVLFYSF